MIVCYLSVVINFLTMNVTSAAVVDRGSLGSGSDGPCSPGSDVPDTPTLSSFHLRRLGEH